MGRAPKILWLEDNPRIVELFREEFESFFGVHQVETLGDLRLLSVQELNDHDAVLLDMELPEGAVGLEAIQYLKSVGLRSPVLVLSNDESIQSRIQMLSNGADDYLWKAMDPVEMLVRIKNAILRFQENKKNTEPGLGSLALFPNQITAYLSGKSLELSKIEFHLMLILIRNHPLPVSLDELKSEVWKLPSLEIGTINTFIWKLNKKLSEWEFRIAKLGETVALHSKSIE